MKRRMYEENKGLRDILSEINEKLDEGVLKKKKEKKFWMPLGARVGKSKVKHNWITICKINENRGVTFEKQQISEQTILIDGAPRVITADDVLIYKNKPFVILPNWSTKPFSPTENYEETAKKNYASQGYRLLLNRMQGEVLKAKRKFKLGAIFVIIIIVIVIGYFVSKGGLF